MHTHIERERGANATFAKENVIKFKDLRVIKVGVKWGERNVLL